VISRVAIGTATLVAGHGGIARVARMSARCLIETDHKVTMTSYLDRAPEAIGGIRASNAHASKLLFFLLCHRAALAASHCFYDSAALARAHPRLAGFSRPYAVWMHGIEAWESLRSNAAAALRRADLVLVNSNYTLERFQRLHGELPSARVCWLATEEDDWAATAEPGPPTVLILGRIDEGENYKGHAELIAAWPRVIAIIPRARLVIAGGGSGITGLRNLVGQTTAKSHIEILGFVPEADIISLWRRATVFAMPSSGEGFGLVYIEAMRRGLPVIASMHGAGREVNVDGVTGYNVSPGRAGELAARLIALLADPHMAARMGRAGRERWQRYFRFSAFKDRFVPLFEEFVGRTRR
jgi:phosphatidylinositol alpha-1,6-mannosyltransferase